VAKEEEMATGIIRIVAAAVVAALALAAPALAKPQASPSYDIAALKAMGARYEAMADYYLGSSGSASFRLPEQTGWNRFAGEQQVGIASQPDGYQPQLHTTADSSDVVSRYVDRRVPVVGGRDLPDGFQPQLRGPEAVPVSGTEDGFDWRIFGIATGSALLAAALGGAALLATRMRGRVAHP
jgi:hypothetical protein